MEENITSEFVKEWIDKHHLRRNSHESVLSDVLTNNGHYYIDNPYLRDWIKTNAVEFRELLPRELNENQQIVLDHLIEAEQIDQNVQYTLWNFFDDLYEEPAMGIGLTAHTKAWLELKDDEQFQLLAAFAEWGLKEVAE